MSHKSIVLLPVCFAGLVLALGCDQGGSGGSPAVKAEKTSHTTTTEVAMEEGGSSVEPAQDAGTAESSAKQKPSRPTYRDPAARAGASAVLDENAALPVAGEFNPKPIDLTQEDYIVIVEPAVLDLGDIPLNEEGKGSFTLINTGPEPMVLVDCKTSCGCTTTNCRKGKPIQAGEKLKVDVGLKGGTRVTKLNKYVTFIVEGQPPLRAQVSGNAIAFAEVQPAIISPDGNPDGKLTLRALDGTEFRITGMRPKLIEAFAEEPAIRHELIVPWDRWEKMGSSRKLAFDIDHPKSSQLVVTVRVPRRQFERAGASGFTTESGDVVSVERQSRLVVRHLVNLINQGDVDEVMKRIDSGEIDVNATDRGGMSLLGIAAKQGKADIVQALIDAGADVESYDNLMKTPVMNAAESGNVEVLRMLLDAGADLNARDKIGGTALSWAALHGSPDTVRELIDAGAEVEAVGEFNSYTPLIWAAVSGHPESLGALLDAGARIEAADNEGMTALLHSVRAGSVPKAMLLLERGANLEVRDADGLTPVLTAVRSPSAGADMLQTLVDAGAALDVKDSRGWTIADYARRRTDKNAGEVRRLVETLVPGAATGDDT